MEMWCWSNAKTRNKVPHFYNKSETKTGMTKKKKKHNPQNCQVTHKSNIFHKMNNYSFIMSFSLDQMWILHNASRMFSKPDKYKMPILTPLVCFSTFCQRSLHCCQARCPQTLRSCTGSYCRSSSCTCPHADTDCGRNQHRIRSSLRLCPLWKSARMLCIFLEIRRLVRQCEKASNIVTSKPPYV